MALKKTGRQIPDQTTETRTVEEQSAPILQLPNDILTLVLEKAVLKDDGPISSSEESIEIYDNQSTLRVTRTCRAFYSCAIAFLYQSIHLDCSNDKGVRKVTRLGEALERTPVLAWSCSELSVRVPEYDWGFPPRQLSRVVGRLGHVRTLRVHGCLFLLNPAHSPSSWTLLRLAPMFMPKLEHLHLSGNMSIQVHPLIEELDFPSLRTVRLGHISTSKRGRKGELRLNPERKVRQIPLNWPFLRAGRSNKFIALICYGAFSIQLLWKCPGSTNSYQLAPISYQILPSRRRFPSLDKSIPRRLGTAHP